MSRSESPPALALNHGLTFAELLTPEGLLKIDGLFLDRLRARDARAEEQLSAAATDIEHHEAIGEPPQRVADPEERESGLLIPGDHPHLEPRLAQGHVKKPAAICGLAKGAGPDCGHRDRALGSRHLSESPEDGQAPLHGFRLETTRRKQSLAQPGDLLGGEDGTVAPGAVRIAHQQPYGIGA